MAKPKQLWWVEFKLNKSKKVGNRHWAAPKGGKFSTLDSALDRAKTLRRTYPDSTVTIYGSGLINWTDTGL